MRGRTGTFGRISGTFARISGGIGRLAELAGLADDGIAARAPVGGLEYELAGVVANVATTRAEEAERLEMGRALAELDYWTAD